MPTLFIMLNPSTADAEIDDPTIRRCMGFAKSWGRDGIEVVNLFAFRATSPKDMQTAADPVGPENEVHVKEAVAECFEVICAWGAHGSFKAQDMVMQRWLREAGVFQPYSLGETMDGQPRHPLYLKANLQPRSYPSVCGGSDDR